MRNDAPSDTAVLIAKSLLLLSRDERRRCLVHHEEAALLDRMIRKAGGGSAFSWLTRRHAGRTLLFGIEKLLLDGIQIHYACRKRWIERQVRGALAAGIRQVVVVAAGFDLLSWRLRGEFPGVRFFELDHPATQRPKREALGDLPGLHFLPVDLSATGVREALAAHLSYRVEEGSVCIAEGLLMYLEEDRVLALLSELADIASPAGSVIFTFMERDSSGSIDFRGQSPLIGRWLAGKREPFRWGIAREGIPAFLSRAAIQAAEVADHEVFREGILMPAGLGSFPLARGECVCHGLPSQA